MNFFDPSTTEGSLTLGILGGLISGAIIGFFSGRGYEKMNHIKKKIKQRGNENIAIQDSNIGGEFGVKKGGNNPEGRQ